MKKGQRPEADPVDLLVTAGDIVAVETNIT